MTIPWGNEAPGTLSRRQFIAITAVGTVGLYVGVRGSVPVASAAVPDGLLDPLTIPKFRTPLLIPPVMPQAGRTRLRGGRMADYYEISVRQFRQQILPAGLPATTVWGYGAVRSASSTGIRVHNAPSLTIEASSGVPVARQVDQRARGRQRELPAAPAAGRPHPALGQPAGRQRRPRLPAGLHHDTRQLHRTGADGHAPPRRCGGQRRERRLRRGVVPARGEQHPGRLRDRRAPGTTSSRTRRSRSHDVPWDPGSATFQYPNTQRATTIWYHDHTLGMTRRQRLRRPGRASTSSAAARGDAAVLDSAPAVGQCCPARRRRQATRSPPTKPTTRSRSRSRTARSTPTARSSTPTRRDVLRRRSPVRTSPTATCSPIWNPEFFGNTHHGQRQHLAVPRRRAAPLPVPLPQRLPVALPDPRLRHDPGRRGVADRQRGRLPRARRSTSPARTPVATAAWPPAERADVIVDFTDVPRGHPRPAQRRAGRAVRRRRARRRLRRSADPDTTGQVMQFDVVPAVEPGRPPPRRSS